MAEFVDLPYSFFSMRVQQKQQRQHRPGISTQAQQAGVERQCNMADHGRKPGSGRPDRLTLGLLRIIKRRTEAISSRSSSHMLCRVVIRLWGNNFYQRTGLPGSLVDLRPVGSSCRRMQLMVRRTLTRFLVIKRRPRMRLMVRRVRIRVRTRYRQAIQSTVRLEDHRLMGRLLVH